MQVLAVHQMERLKSLSKMAAVHFGQRWGKKRAARMQTNSRGRSTYGCYGVVGVDAMKRNGVKPIVFVKVIKLD